MGRDLWGRRRRRRGLSEEETKEGKGGNLTLLDSRGGRQIVGRFLANGNVEGMCFLQPEEAKSTLPTTTGSKEEKI